MGQKKGTAAVERDIITTERTLDRPVNLKELAIHLGLSPTSLSLVLNDSPAANSIPQETKNRILAAAKEFNYRPNFIARSLRAQRTYTVGVMVPELSDGYSAMVLSGIADFLLQERYFYFVASHRHCPKLIESYPKLFTERRVEGLLAVDTPHHHYHHHPQLPVVSVSGCDSGAAAEGVASIIMLDHDRAATLALEHLISLGHRHIAFFKGQDFSSDTKVRWESIQRAASKLEVPIHSALVEQLVGNTPSPETGYIAARKLLSVGERFTALFAFNDVSAVGATRALREAGLRVPEDVSVIGFDDVHAAAFHNPALTTIRQPLWQMGRLAADHLLQQIAHGSEASCPKRVMVDPELIIRQSTARASSLD